MRRRDRLTRLRKDQQVRDEVRMIMRMWLVIERACDRLSEDDRKRVEAEADPYGYDVKFEGFAGNEEIAYLGAAREMAYGDFERFRGRDLNSHLPSLPAYRRMLDRFDIIRSNTSSGDLSVADLIALLREQIHPDNREQ